MSFFKRFFFRNENKIKINIVKKKKAKKKKHNNLNLNFCIHTYLSRTKLYQVVKNVCRFLVLYLKNDKHHNHIKMINNN